MRFKSDKQRKAVMAKLSFSQLQKRGVYLKYQGDADKDGVKNIKDCKPLDPNRQGFIHDWMKKRKQVNAEQRRIKKYQERLELKEDEQSRKKEIDANIRIQRKAQEAALKERERQAILKAKNDEVRKVKEQLAAEKAKRERWQRLASNLKSNTASIAKFAGKQLGVYGSTTRRRKRRKTAAHKTRRRSHKGKKKVVMYV